MNDAHCRISGFISANSLMLIGILTTVARWPNFRPNNSKEAQKNCPWPEKIGGRQMAEFCKKWQKRDRIIILQLFS
jgi:hypothetical protein